jgi:NADH-quinone oxidoreductase subunit L
VTTIADAVTPVAASGVFSLTWVLIGLPLLGALVLLVAGKRANRWGHLFGVLMPVASFVVAAVLFFAMLGQAESSRTIHQHLYDWVVVGTFQVPFALQLDQLSMAFVLLITGVGSLIHVYSVGYMAEDPDRRKFFGYLNLFVAAMLLLVLADNYLLLYLGWEGVGLASYLLIGFWLHKPTAAAAAQKAFVVNRVGDMGMSIAVMIMFVTFGSVTFSGVFAGVGQADETTMTWLGLALLLGACAKSAQFPLQSWLLDAMEGPTPVSALIHAATMVTAGVYLIARSNVIFDAAPTAAMVVIIVGAITLLMGAIIGCAKDDIKKSLAGSTMSQIGYMVLAAGLGPIGYVFAIFHLLTHGFFKATLFLGAGSVMHGMNDEVDMRRFGALRTVMVLTFTGFVAAYLAILGIPPFSGFFSKDKIIEAAFSKGVVVGLVTLLGAGITAFYMTRMVAMTFTGKARWDDDAHPHESPSVMTIPILVLAFLSTIGGIVLAWNSAIEDWLAPVVGFAEPHIGIPAWLLSVITLLVVIAGALLAWRQYGTREVPVTAPHGSLLTRAARADLYGDVANEALLMRPGQWLTRTLVWVDNRVVDGLVNGSAAMIGGLSSRSRRWQTGFARSYALSMLGGVILVACALVVVRL